MSSILKALSAKRFKSPAYVMLREVRNATGWAANRAADAIVVSCWPSHGLWLGGIEQKVSRGDWLRELKQPEKAHAIMRYCAHWWVATTPGIVRDGELPENWGLLEVDDAGKVTEKVRAPKLTPEPITLDFVCALLRNHAEGFEGELARARQSGVASVKLDSASANAEDLKYELDMARREAKAAKERAERLQLEVSSFERRTGACVAGLRSDVSAQTYRAARSLGELNLERMANVLRATAAELDAAGVDIAEQRAALDRAAEAEPR